MKKKMELLNRDKDTICAPATGPALGAISVIRISGPETVEIVRRLAEFLPPQLESHKIYYGHLGTIDSHREMDEVLVSYFAKGRSYTGESTCEISCHGNSFIVDEVLRQLVLAGARMAERGEFTYRAFMNGRLDLIQAESVLSVIESRSAQAARVGLRQLQGGLSQEIQLIRDDLTWVLAQLEANIDFASEDILIAANEALLARINSALDRIQKCIAGFKQGRGLQEGFEVVLAGRPNVGKSSLLNRLLSEQRAIVSPIAGTTRDLVEGQLHLDGVLIKFVDTAGLRETGDEIEHLGVERATARIQSADLVLLIDDKPELFDWLEPAVPEKSILVFSKSDLYESNSNPVRFSCRVRDVNVESVRVSNLSGHGLDELIDLIKSRLKTESSEESTWVCNARQFEGLKSALGYVEAAKQLILGEESPDLVALELGEGLQSVYGILGIVYDDQVMDRVFSEFCLGK